jgi:hypothetical protein
MDRRVSLSLWFFHASDNNPIKGGFERRLIVWRFQFSCQCDESRVAFGVA